MGRGGLLAQPPSSEAGEGEAGGRSREAGKKEMLTADPKANSRHGSPAPPPQMDALCKKILSEFETV